MKTISSAEDAQGIFGSQFFNFDAETRAVVTATNFPLFWFITMPLTAAVFIVYGAWQWSKQNSQAGNVWVLLQRYYTWPELGTKDILSV